MLPGDPDYDRLFARSGQFTGLVTYAESGVDRRVYGNAPWTRQLCSPSTYQTWCQAFADLSLAVVADRLGEAAMANLSVAQALFGNRQYPGVLAVPARAIDLLDNETARRAGRVAAEHLALVDELPKPHLLGNTEALYDFGVRMTPRTAGLRRP